MKLCFLADSNSWHVKKWLEYFADQDYEVHIISTEEFWDKRVTSHVIETITYDRQKGFWNFISSYRKFKRIIKAVGPDVLHAISLRNGIFAALNRFRPFILTSLGWDILQRPKISFFKKLETSFILSKTILTTSDSIHTQYEMLKYQKNKICELIIIGVDKREFNDNVQTEELKKSMGLNSEKIVLSPRSMMENSNLDIIIMSIPLVLKKIPNTVFIFKYNYGHLKTKMEKLADKLGVSKNVRFVGFLDNYKLLPAFYKISNVSISILTSDSTGRAWFESIACGAPLILSDIPNTHEWFTHDVDALIVPLRDYRQTAKAIIKILSNNELKESLLANARKHIQEKADYHINMRKMENIYLSLIKN